MRNARTYLNRRLSESILQATPRQKPRVILTIFLAPSRVFDSAARHPSADAIAQFGQRTIMAVRPNLNFKDDFERTSAVRATIRVFADAHQHCPSQPPEPQILTTTFFRSCPLFFLFPR